jgi:hypothetical protein
MASDLLIPVDWSCPSACRASGSSRTLIADDMIRLYHSSSYGSARLAPTSNRAAGSPGRPSRLYFGCIQVVAQRGEGVRHADAPARCLPSFARDSGASYGPA